MRRTDIVTVAGSALPTVAVTMRRMPVLCASLVRSS